MDVLDAIQDWYLSQCDGDWEHDYGFHIGTLDNPGWMVDVDLINTPLEDKEFAPTGLVERSENDWIFCKVIEGKFQGSGGPKNLTEILRVFLEWAKESN